MDIAKQIVLLFFDENDNESPKQWKDVDVKWQDEFKAWCVEEKQQSWEGMWDKGWRNYEREFIGYLYKIHLQEKQSKYDPKFGDNKACKCGHVYYRHFDSYDDMFPCGCKYCSCDEYKETPEDVDEKVHEVRNE